MAMEIFRLVGRITYEGQRTVEQGLTRLQEHIGNAEKKLEKFGAAATAVGDKTKSIGEGFSKNVTAPLMAVGAAGMFMADEMQQSQGRIQASLGITEGRAEELNGVAKALWKDAFGENVGEAADAVTTVEKNMGSLNDADLQGVTSQAFILKDLFEYDINESTRTGKALMDNFGVSGAQAMDYITRGAQLGGDYSQELLDVISEYSGDFASAGMDIDGMFNILLQGAEAGALSLDKVGDSVKEFNIRAKDGSDGTAEAFDAIGLNAEKMGTAIANGGEKGEQAFMATVAGLAAMENPIERNAAGVALFGTQWEDVKENVILAMDPTKDMLGEVEGATQKAGDALYDNFGTRLTTAFRTVQDALVPLGEVLINMIEPAIASMSGKVEQLANWFGSLSAKNQQFLVILGLIAAAVGPFLVALGTIISSIGAIATAIAAVGLVASAWIIGIVAIIAVLALLYAKFAPFRELVNGIFTAALTIVQTAMAAIVLFVQEKLAVLVQFWTENGAQIMQAVTNAFNMVKSVIDFIMPAILFVITMVWNNIKGLITGVLNVIMGAIKIFAGLFTGDFAKMWEGVKQLFFGAIQAIWNYMNLMFVGRIIGIIKSFVLLGRNLIVGFGKTLVTNFKNMMTSANNAVSSGVAAVVRFFRNMVNNAVIIFRLLRSMGASIFGAIRSTITSIASNIYSRVVASFRNMQTGAVNAFNGVKNRASSIFGAVKNAIQNPIRTATDFVRRQVDKIKGFFNNMRIKFPSIKLPHFKIRNWSLNPANWVSAPPSIGIDWYKKGGVFGGASVIGVGEEPGVKEAVIPLKTNVLADIGKGIAAASNTSQGAAGGEYGTRPAVNHVHVYIGNEQIAEYVEPIVSDIQGAGVRSTNRIWGEKE